MLYVLGIVLNVLLYKQLFKLTLETTFFLVGLDPFYMIHFTPIVTSGASCVESVAMCVMHTVVVCTTVKCW